MLFLTTAIVSGNRVFLTEQLIQHGGIPPEKTTLLKQASLETLVKIFAKFLCYESGSEPLKAPAVNIYFIRNFGELTRILVSITNHPDFTCFGVSEAIGYLNNQGIELKLKQEQMLSRMFYLTAFAFEQGILQRT